MVLITLSFSFLLAVDLFAATAHKAQAVENALNDRHPHATLSLDD
jgi:hypothetical protein